MRSGAGQTDVGRVDADRIHEMQNAHFLLERWIGHRRRLQTVAQCLVVEFDLSAAFAQRHLGGSVPVVDEILKILVHTISDP